MVKDTALVPSHVDNSTLGYTSKSFKINFKEVE